MGKKLEPIKSNDPNRVEKLKKRIEVLESEHKFLKDEKRKNMIQQGVIKFDIDDKIELITNKIRKANHRLRHDGAAESGIKRPKRAVSKSKKKNEEADREADRRFESLYSYWLEL